MAVVAIDGPSGAGKSSASRSVASHFGWSYLDTGALYRALTLFVLEEKISQLESLPHLLDGDRLSWYGDPVEPAIFLDGRNVNREIRNAEVTAQVSAIAANPEVRGFLLSLQRSIINRADAGIVVEGRDIGSTVWPDAELKIFLTADLTARAERRSAELGATFSDSEVQKALSARDVIDSSRTTSPLRQIPEQIVIDATHLSLEEVVSEIKKLIHQLGLHDVGESRG